MLTLYIKLIKINICRKIMNISTILLSLACVFVSINAADICGIPKIKPVFHPTLNNDELGNIVGGYDARPAYCHVISYCNVTLHHIILSDHRTVTLYYFILSPLALLSRYIISYFQHTVLSCYIIL